MTDSLSISWTGLEGYAFPPEPLILLVLQKVKRDGNSDYNSTELGETTVDISSDRSTGGDTKEVASKTKAPKTSCSAEVSSKSGNPNLYA